MRLLIATHNRGKLSEYRELLAGLPLELVTLDDVGIHDDVAETGATFAENARLKAITYARQSGLLTLADDSGLEVDALGGAPGVRSKRYAGDDATDAARIAFLLDKLRAVPRGKRGARFKCVIVIASPQAELRGCLGIHHKDTKDTKIWRRPARVSPILRVLCAFVVKNKFVKQPLRELEGTCEGEIAFAPRGTNGFGYDPVFLFPERGLTMAELSDSEKNRVSHRARAAMKARQVLG